MKDFLNAGFVPVGVRKAGKLSFAFITLFLSIVSAAWGLPHASFTTDQTSGCSPLSVQFTSTSTGASSYYWDFGDGNSSTLANPSELYTSPGSYTVMLVTTDAAGNKDTLTATNVITVIDKPTSNFYSPTPSACIDNNSISFVSTSTGAVSYLWDFGDGTLFSNQPSPVHTYAIPGSYNITLIVYNSFGCSDIKIVNHYISIHPPPQASFTVNTNVACGTTQSIAFASTSAGANAYSWNFGDGTSSTSQNPSHTYSTPGTYSVSLIATSQYGCVDTSKNSQTINVNNGNWATFSSNIDSGCAPMNVGFTCGVSGVSSVTWNFGDGGSSTVINPSHVYKFPGNYTVSMTVLTINGCTATVTMPNYIIAGISPVVNFSISDTSVCNSFPIQFTNNCSNTVSYSWSFGDGTFSNNQNPTHTYADPGIYTVALNCKGVMGCAVENVKTNVIHITKDIANFNGTPRVSCPPMTVNFTDLSQGNKLSYFWKFGDGTTSTQKNPSHTYNNSGTYDVTLVIADSSGCSDTLFRPAYVQVIDPTSNYTTPDTTVSCAPLTTQFTDNTAGAVSWLWDFGDGTTSNLQNPVHTYANPGIYSVSLTTQLSGGCTQTINTFRVFKLKGGIAKFHVEQTQCPPYIITLTDSSTNAVSWFWNFGDGGTSTLQNPAHSYGSPGYYSISLTITTADGCIASTMYSNCVYFPPFQANFYAVPQNIGIPQTINFYANSTNATGWFWDFGDGGTSTDENPTYTYDWPGNYTVSLTITQGACSLTYSPPPFSPGNGDTIVFNTSTSSPPQPQAGCAPFFVTFNNNDPAYVSWVWDFGDGTGDSSANTYHIYNNAGVYNVRLTTVDTTGTVTTTVLDSLVRVYGPVAKFSYLQGSSCQNTAIAFRDSSTGGANWLWDFGDGTTDTTENPHHLYTGHNTNYIVSLRVSDNVGCSSALSTSIFSSFVDPIIVMQTDVCSGDTVHLSTSLQNYSSYHWDFGDSTSSATISPSHIYSKRGVYDVALTVTDSSGCSQTFHSNPSITVNAPVAQFSANKIKSCTSFTANFINQSSGGDYYWWDFGDSTGSSAINPSHFYIDSGSYTVTLTVYSGNCVSTIVKNNYINIYKAHAEYSLVKDGICLPMSIQFTDLSNNAVSWKWDFADGSASAQQDPLHIYLTAPTSSIKLKITDIHGCVDSMAHAPPSTLQDNFVASGDSGCIPFNVQFTEACVMATSFTWDFGDGTTSTLANPQHTYTKGGSYDVTLTITSGYNCSKTLTMPNMITALDTKAAFVSPDLSACAPSVVNFSNLSQYSTSWKWDFGDGSGSTNQTPSHIYNTPGVYDIKLVASTAQGCADSTVKLKYITVLGPVTSFSISATEGCKPFTPQFTDHSKNAISYAWSFGDGYSSIDQNPLHTYSDTGSFTAALVTHDSTGCSSYFAYPVPVIIHDVPKASFATNDTMGCQPYLVTFNNTSSRQDSTIWNFYDGTSSTAGNPSHTYLTPGNYFVSLIALNQYGCSDTATMNKPIKVNMTPDVDFSVSSSVGCTPLIVTFKDSSSNLLNPSYKWNFGNGQTSTSTNPTTTFIHPGFYDVSLAITNGNGCSDSLTKPGMIQVYDTLPPAISPIYSVSVKSNTSVEIIWENNAAIDLGSYQLFRYNEATSVWDNIYNEFNPNNTNFSLTSSYVDNGLNTLQNTYSYKLLTGDICGNAIGLDQLTAHTTINISAEQSGTNIQVSWTPYEGCSISGYSLYRTDQGSTSARFIGNLEANELSYIDTTLDCPYTYSYRVIANDLGGRPYTSYSDTAMATPENVFLNQYSEVVRTTVVDNQYVLTEWRKPAVQPQSVIQYDLYRSTDNENFSYLTSIPSVQTDYLDHSVDVQRTNYYYKVVVVNRCNIEESPSDMSSSILLTGQVNDDYIFRLHWTDYKHWANGVDYYAIEKQDDNGNWAPAGKVDGHTTDFQDR